LKKITFKYIAAVVITVVLTLVPFIREAMANPQGNVIDLRFGGDITRLGATYNIEFLWSRPERAAPQENIPAGNVSHNVDLEAPGRPGPLPTGTHPGDGRAYFYELMRAEASTTNFTFLINDPSGADQTFTHRAQGMGLNANTIYAFRVFPMHHEGRWVWAPSPPPPPGAGEWNWQDLPVQRGSSNTVMFMTDIVPRGSARSGRIEVSWEVPTLDGQPAFDAWRVFIVESGGPFTPAGIGFQYFNVEEDDPNLTRTGNTWTYAIRSGLRPLQDYDIKIEPLVRVGGDFALARTLGQLNGLPLRFTSNSEYRYDNIPMGVELRVYDDVFPYIMLDWAPGFGNLNVTSVALFYSANPQDLMNYINTHPQDPLDEPRWVAKIDGASIGTIHNIRTERPGEPVMYYMLAFKINDGPWQGSDPVPYYAETPEFHPTKPVIRDAEHNDDPLRLSITWDAFLRTPFGDERVDPPATPAPGSNNPIRNNSDRGIGLWHDTMIEYDIFISDSIDPLRNNTIPANMSLGTFRYIDGSPLQLNTIADHPGLSREDRRKYDYTYTLSNLTHFYSVSHGQLMPIVENRVYYIKVVARQIAASAVTGSPRESVSYYAYPIPASGVLTRPNMISKPPLRIVETALHNITVEWDTQYYEAYNPGLRPGTPGTPAEMNDHAWHTKIGWDGNKFVFGEDLRFSEKTLELTQSGLREASGNPNLNFNAANPRALIGTIYEIIINYFSLPYDADDMPAELPLRFVDFLNPAPEASFALMWIPYSQVMPLDDPVLMRAYIDSYLRGQLTGGSWPGPDATGGILIDAEGRRTIRHPIDELEPQTSYLIFLWPFLPPSPPQFFAHEPANIIGTTLGEHPPFDVTPTVPLLEPRRTGDMHLTVGWFFNTWFLAAPPGYFYELYFSEFAGDYETNGITIENDIIRAQGIPLSGGEFNPLTGLNDPFIEFTVDNLFPETTYYIWIRAYTISPINGDRIYSAYSNYITMRTDELTPPPPPTGLGLIGANNLDIINKMNDRQEGPFDISHITFEWSRIGADQGNPAHFSREQVLEGDAAVLTDSLGALADESWATIASYIVKFDWLDPNTAYYARVKTRLTVTKMEMGSALREYQYIIQLSKTEDFFSYIEVIIPSGISGGSGTFIQKESEWTRAVRIYTDLWSGEHDGDIDPATYPLPDDDFEWIYDAATQTLTYRFRSTGTDQHGNRDNSVDMRFINWLINSRIYNFTIPFEAHPFGNVQIRRYAAEIPYSVYSAMADRHIGLTLIAGNATYAFPAKYLDIPEVQAMTGFGFGADIQITAEDNPADAPRLNADISTYSARPNKLSIRVTAGMNTHNVTRTILPFTVTQRAESRAVLFAGNTAGYQSTFATAAWNIGDYTVDTAALTISQTTHDVCTYAGITFAAPVIVSHASGAEDVLHRVNSHITFEAMPYYFPQAEVSSGQFNKLAAAIAAGNGTVNINAALTSDEHNSLARAGLLAPATDVMTRQEAVSLLVKLYELKIKSQIRSHTPLAQSLHFDIRLADEQYHSSLLKAADLGFFENTENAVRPLEPMTMEELLRIVDIIIEYAGL